MKEPRTELAVAYTMRGSVCQIVSRPEMDPTYPNAKAAQSPKDHDRLLKIVARRNLCGLANDTKWDELINAMRARTGWRPRYRFKCIDGPPSSWDGEWFYHLPFPMLSVEWLDLSYIQEVQDQRQPPRTTFMDHSKWIEPLFQEIGLDYRKGTTIIRIFGYSPRNLDLLDE